MAETKKKGNPILFGLVLLGGSIGAIWKNEHRFDYHQAAEATEAVENVGELAPAHLFSHTGKMDQGLTLKGQYVRSFQGFLEVKCSAEIYAWDRDEDDDGVSWSKEWMSYLQENERNEDLSKRLKSDTFRPDTYQIADLTIDPTEIQFIDEREEIHPSKLQLTRKGKKNNLSLQGDYFYLLKDDEGEGDPADDLGDERLSYRGLPVPETATYFGKWGEGRAVVHQAEKKEGMLSDIINDKGILHHLVAGERETALDSMKEHLAHLKKMTRLIALAVATIGGGVLFSSLTRFLVFIPLVGTLVNRISGWLGMLIGFLLGFITLILAFLSSHPLILALFLLALASGLFFLWKNAKQKREGVKAQLSKTLGYQPSQNELEELEFIGLWQLLASDGTITTAEKKQLKKWTKRHRWSTGRVEELTQRAQAELAGSNPRDTLQSLICFTLADGNINRTEMKSLEQAATKIGVAKPQLFLLIAQAQRT